MTDSDYKKQNNLDPQQLIEGHFLGHLSQEESDALEVMLLENSQLRDDFRRAATLDTALRDCAIEEDINKQVLSPVQPARTQGQSLYFRRAAVLAVGLSLMVLVGLALFFSMHQVQPALASVETITGKLLLVSDSEHLEISEGMKISDGTEIACPPGRNEAVIRLSDGSLFRVSSGTRVRFSKADRQYRLKLFSGFLTADVMRQPPSRPLLIETPTADVTVLGTELTLSLASEQTQLIVDEGRVEMKKRLNDERVVVATKQTAIASKDEPLLATSLEDLEVASLEIIRASYGAQATWIDVTDQVRSRATNSRLIPLDDFNNLAGDPLYLVVKTLKIEYRIDGKPGQAEFNEYTTPNRPKSPKRTKVILPIHNPTLNSKEELR